MRQRVNTREIKVGGKLFIPRASGYCSETIKSFTVTKGVNCPTKAYYDDGTTVQNQDDVIRVVLASGMIHYLKRDKYKIVN